MFQANCRDTAGECEVEIGGETYLAMSVRQTFGDSVRLVSFQSVDAATKKFTQGFVGVFPLVGAPGSCWSCSSLRSERAPSQSRSWP
jgi:hypothetical protein